MARTLVALDIDGTLMPTSGQLSVRTNSACRDVQAREAMEVTLCTGREWSRSVDIANEIGCRWALTGSGAMILERQEAAGGERWRVLRRRWMGQGVALKVLGLLELEFTGRIIVNLDYDVGAPAAACLLCPLTSLPRPPATPASPAHLPPVLPRCCCPSSLAPLLSRPRTIGTTARRCS